jgi:hypothetical protein
MKSLFAMYLSNDFSPDFSGKSDGSRNADAYPETA